MSALEQLKKYTTVVADTGDFESIAAFKPQDATTNPSLILAATQKPQYAKLIDEAVVYGKNKSSDAEEQLGWALDKLLVNFGTEILKIVPGRVSTEVDARLSFDAQATIEKAIRIIDLYAEAGVKKERVLIKIASTWEGIQAAKVLEEKHQIHCNLTLLFGFPRPLLAPRPKLSYLPLCRPHPRWYKKSTGQTYTQTEDPGVSSVQKIYNYYKKHGYTPLSWVLRSVMLEKLRSSLDAFSPRLDKAKAIAMDIPKVTYDEKNIRNFAADNIKLENAIRAKLSASA
ncbi:hypothetical protein BC829DRAFT_487704 [Chytridium lagenaria]|nr:hypothetical protein BC829DRAFT_487704 [Chytridium lagenaria]